MKKVSKLTLLISFSVLMGLIIFPTACDRINSSQSEPELLNFEQFEVYGEIHNQFLTNVKNNFTPDNEIGDLNNALNYLNDFQQDFLQQVDLKGLDKNELSRALSNSKDLSIHEKAYQKMFIRSKKSTSFNNEPTLFELLSMVREEGLLDEFEYQSLTELSTKVKDSYEGYISDDELKTFVLDLKSEWLEQGYTVDSQNGILMAYALSISLASLDWWEENAAAGLNKSRKGKVMALPAWAALDIGGAIVGATVTISGQAAFADEINWEIVGYGTLATGITTSTGAAGKVAKWLGLM